MSAGGPPSHLALASRLAPRYSSFRVAERLLLTGHSHQAWPDVARDGQLESFEDAARLADEKWERAFAKAERVRDGYRALLGDPSAELALGQNTHELLLRFLSALDLHRRRRLLTTDGEFHTVRRQLSRLGEDWLDVVRVAAAPADTLAERLADAADERTAAVPASSWSDRRSARSSTGRAGMRTTSTPASASRASWRRRV